MKKVFVGLSGGVDSAVSAARLLARGYDVIGVFIKIWSPDWIGCTSKEDRLEAMRVAAYLNIQFKEIDLTEEYKKRVVDYMLTEYKSGRTPNPDVFCNTFIKFGAFFDWAIGEGADFVATGHYAQIMNHESWSVEHKKIFNPQLLKAVDETKDQSYFLWTLSSEKLAKILFPVGDLQKTEVRKLARKYNLPNAERRDSQGLCFVGNIDVKDFLAQYIKPEKGNVIDEKGNIIGTHSGALLFTIGERHGFEIAKKSPTDEPYFVISKDVAKNTITVAHRNMEISGSAKNEIMIERTNWISIVPKLGEHFSACIRYHAKPISCTISEINGDSAKITFNEPSDSITPGQSLVLYDGDICFGGGIIS